MRVDVYLTDLTWVISGVLQGSVLGPLLFIIIMLDIDGSVSDTFLLSSADDTKLWQAALEHNQIQADIFKVNKWVDNNNMMVDCGTYDRLHIGEQGGDSALPYFANDDKDVQINDKEHVKDLGIYISNDFTFDHHIKSMVWNSKIIASWILRVFPTREQYPMTLLLKTLLVPTAEYGCLLER